MKRILYVIILTIVAVSCGRRSENWATIVDVESYIEECPDSALAVLRAIDSSELSCDEERARYALLLSMALDKNYVDTTSFVVLQPAIDYYLENGTPDEKLRTLYYQGRIFQNRGDEETAMQSFIRGQENMTNATDTFTIANLLVAQGVIYYNSYKFDSYIENSLNSAKLYSAINKQESEFRCLAKVLEGAIITDNKELADSLLTIINDRVLRYPELEEIIRPHLMSYTINFGTKEEISQCLEKYILFDSINSYLKLDLAIGYNKIGEYDTAISALNSINEEFQDSLKYLAIKSKVLENRGDFENALNAYHKFYAISGAKDMKLMSQNIWFADELHKSEIESLMARQSRTRTIWLTSICILILFLAIIFIYYRYRLLKAKKIIAEEEKSKLTLEADNLQKEQQRLILEKEHAELERQSQALIAENMQIKIEQLEAESRKLKELLKNHSISKSVENVIKQRIEMLNSLLATHISENISRVEPYKDLCDQIVQDKDRFMNTTRLTFKATHPQFIEYLEQHKLTDSEINYLCLYAIGLKGKEVGEYIQLKRHYHISANIRKKLALERTDTNIGIYVQRLMKSL